MNRDGTPSELDRDREDAEDRQRLFVQQVAEALVGLVGRVREAVHGWQATDEVIANELAPEVAAAILAAITKVNGCHCCADEMGWAEPQKASLAALAQPEERAPWETQP